MLKKVKYILILSIFIFANCSRSTSDQQITFGTLPVIQALPIFVANDLGLFEQQGIQVDIISFNSALESQIAISAKQIDGYFADIITPIILKSNGTDLKIISTLFKTDSTQRMFALLAPPGNKNLNTKVIASDGIAISANTIIDYLTLYLLKSIDLEIIEYSKIDIKKIPIRLQLLLQNQVAAAVLPEPLVTFAEQNGAVVIADDKLLNMTPTVAVFSSKYLSDNKKSTGRFLAALAKAIEIINFNPQKVRNIMLKNCQVPELLQDTFPVPKFPTLDLPSEESLQNAYNWLTESNIIDAKFNIKDLLVDEYLP